jgi:adenine-specific DNA-methyltransferase
MTQPRVKRAIEGFDYVKRGAKGKRTKMHEPALGGTFTYARVGRRLFGEYRDFGDELPAYDELAKYVFYTETSQDFDAKAAGKKTGRLGEFHGTAYYLLYTPDPKKDGTLDLDWLKTVAAADPCRKLVVYCEKLWLHRDDLSRWQNETGKSVRTMLVPFNLR